tara:strand:+ start:147972 stop:149888 length:1917 start_codon:yes stop_codon:yes gene_type:complete
MVVQKTVTNWNIKDSAELYKVSDWAADYFDISARGEVEIVAPGYDKPVRISLMDVVSGMQERGLHMPVMLRIENILDHRISLLNESFARAVTASGYQNHYRGVFPIKVNQQCHVVEEIAQFGARYHHGLEAGSKAELIIALANLSNTDSYIICNGYKDEEFIDLGLHARRMDIKCFFVVETPAELQIIIRRSKALGVAPLIGVRAKLASEVDGHWSEDSGDRSLFGLSATQLIDVVDALKHADMLDALQLLHFHIGSQIPNIRNIRAGMAEAIRYYVGLAREGAPMGQLDIGGGLAVDYEGAHNSGAHSKNYSLDEYCTDVVESVMETLDPLGLPHPVILSESGRATVAYSSILMFNILDVTNFEPGPLPEVMPEDCSEHVQRLFETNEQLTVDNAQRCYNNAAHYRDEVREHFRRGELDLRERALGENMYLHIMQRITGLMQHMERVPQDLESLQEDLADIYYGNFSVFQSLPDTWAIEQLFPVLPIHRLDEEPSRHAIIADLTCDCDGKIDNFIGGDKTVALHPLKEAEDYYVGVFLVGAYQETLGDLHNLFGDTNIISIHINEDGSFDFIREIHGDSIADVLSYVEYSPEHILEQFRNNAEKAVRRGVISAPTRQKIMEAYSASLRGYTYYETQE